MTLQGKRIVVLGGSSGIGLATAQAAHREGAKVIIASSQQARVNQALSSIPGAEGYAVDLTDTAAVQAFFTRIGAFDHLVFTAGESLQLGPLAEFFENPSGCPDRTIGHRYPKRLWAGLLLVIALI